MKKENLISIGMCFSCDTRVVNGRRILAWNSRARVDKAYILYKLGYINKILCTGRAATLMQKYLADLSVPKKDVMIESKSVETVENIKFSFSMLKRTGYFNNLKTSEELRLVMISEPHHLRRIDIIAQAYLKQYHMDDFVPVLLEPVQYHLSDKAKREEDHYLHITVLDPFGKGDIFKTTREQRRRQKSTLG